MPDLLSTFISPLNPTGAEPVPDAALMNDTQNATISVQPGKTYMFRIVNMAAFAAQYLWIQDHQMQIVEVDGIYTTPAIADMIYITAAQRYSVLVTMKNDTSANFPITGSMDQVSLRLLPKKLINNDRIYSTRCPIHLIRMSLAGSSTIRAKSFRWHQC